MKAENFHGRGKGKVLKVILPMLLVLAGTFPSQAGIWWEDGYLEIHDGDVYDGELFIINNGHVEMFGGIVGKLETRDYSTGNIYDGEIDVLWTDDNTVVDIYGGMLTTLACFPETTVYLYAYDVIFHPADGFHNDPWLEGKYVNDNSTFSFEFYDENCIPQLTVIPEPSSLFLLGLGGLLLCKRK